MIKDVISVAVDSLDNDAKLHLGTIFASGQFIYLAQKLDNDYASALLFGYNINKLLFQLKYGGTWQAVREI